MANTTFTSEGQYVVEHPDDTWERLMSHVISYIQKDIGSFDLTHFTAEVKEVEGQEVYDWRAEGEVLD